MNKKRKTYTSGTMYEQETGRYADPGLYGDFGRPNRTTGSNRKKQIGDGTARVSKGAKVRSASRSGVGQETVDGFVNNNAMAIAKTALKNRKQPQKPPRRR